MLQALRDEVLIKLIFEEHKGLIEIPKSAMKWKQYDAEVTGEVVSIGSKYPYELKLGDRIIFERHEGSRITYEGVKYLKLKEKWVHAKIE